MTAVFCTFQRCDSGKWSALPYVACVRVIGGRVGVVGCGVVEEAAHSIPLDLNCCVLSFFFISADLEWHCRDNGDPNNHYNVRPCAPDKLPELPPGKVGSFSSSSSPFRRHCLAGIWILPRML